MMLGRGHVWRAWLALVGAVLLGGAALGLAATARADEPADLGPGAVEEEGLPLAIVTGSRVNLRAGPRLDNHPLAQLDEGDVVLVVEQVPGWLGVLVPRGFPAAVSLAYVEPEGADALRVLIGNLNLRAHPPQEGLPLPSPLRDRPERGALLTLISPVPPPASASPGSGPETADAAPATPDPAPATPDPAPATPDPAPATPAPASPEEVGASPGGDGWAWVVAPEGVRAYVAESLVRVLGPAGEHEALLEAARSLRREEAERLSAARRALRSETVGGALRRSTAEVQLALGRLRRDGGHDRAPLVALAHVMEAALEACADAPPRVRTIARALREDLEREMELRAARHDAEVARLQGLKPAAVTPLEPKVDAVVLEGEIRYEATPGWEQEGVWILWIQDRPAFVLRLTTGGELPHPDLAAHAGAGLRRIQGKRPGERLFGLPVVDVTALRVP